MNKILFKVHRLLAFLLCVPLLLISLSGSVLVFKHEVDALLMPELVRLAPGNEVRRSFDELLSSFYQAYPDYEVTGWQMYADPGRADLVYVMARGGSEWSSLFFNQYSGRALSPPTSPKYYVTDLVREFHYTFLAGDLGLLLGAVVAVLLCLQSLVGLILHRKFWKVLFTIRYRARPIIYLGDIHKLLGAISAPVLLVLGFTGAFWNINQLRHSVQKPPSTAYVVGERLYNPALSIDALVQESQLRVVGLTPSFISLPSKPGYSIGILGGSTEQHPLYSNFANSVRYNAQTGGYVSMRDIRDSDSVDQVKNSFRRLHFGDFAGNWSRVVWAILGFSPVVLIVSGLAMWRLRRPQRLRQAKRRALQRHEG